MFRNLNQNKTLLLTGRNPIKFNFMKQFIKRTVFFIAAMMLLFAPVTVFAQEIVNENPIETVTELPDIIGIFQTFATLALAIPIVSELVKRLVKASGLAVQIISWGIGIVITFIGWMLNLGFLAGLDWHIMLIYGICASLAANGVFDVSSGITGWLVGLFDKNKK